MHGLRRRNDITAMRSCVPQMPSNAVVDFTEHTHMAMKRRQEETETTTETLTQQQQEIGTATERIVDMRGVLSSLVAKQCQNALDRIDLIWKAASAT